MMLGRHCPTKIPGSWGPRPSPGILSSGPYSLRFIPPCQLVIGYHWLAFLNQVRKESQFIKKFENKIDHISKANGRKKLKTNFTIVSEHCASYGTIL